MLKKQVIILLSFFVAVVIGVIAIYFSVFHYPLKYENEILMHSKKYGLAPKIVASVIYAESKFNASALSSAGAKGLMQLMPKTATEIAVKLGKDNWKEDELNNPSTNIEFGCFYLNYLCEIFEDLNVVFAAYNAGPNTVKNWLQQKEYSENGKTLKVIPFKETENYVKKINKAIKVYSRKIGKISS